MPATVRRVLAVVAIAAVGIAITAVFHAEVVQSEDYIARESFKSAYATTLAAFEGFLQDQLAIRAISDAISTGDSLPQPSALDRVRFCLCSCDVTGSTWGHGAVGEKHGQVLDWPSVVDLSEPIAPDA